MVKAYVIHVDSYELINFPAETVEALPPGIEVHHFVAIAPGVMLSPDGPAEPVPYRTSRYVLRTWKKSGQWEYGYVNPTLTFDDAMSVLYYKHARGAR